MTADHVLRISFDPELEDVIEGRLFLTRSTGNVLIGPGVIEAYFDSAADRDEAATLFENAKAIERPRVDWLEQYRQSLQPLFIGRSFVIAPVASLIPPDSSRHALVIPQEQAFGTGSHESTALCIELVEELDLRGRRVIDIGAGSGILALAMLRLGARKAIAFDNDLDAFAALYENPRRNQMQIAAFIGTIDALRSDTFDVATMNILPDVIVRLLPQVRARVVIVSGILQVQRESVVAAFGRPPQSERAKGEWWAGSFRLDSSRGQR